MTNKVFHAMILPKSYQRDTIDNAKEVIKNIKNEEDYITVMTKCIDYSNDIILETVINTVEKKNLDKAKEKLVKFSLKRGNEKIFELICDFFDINSELPKYDKLENIIYYKEKFINKRNNIDYLTEFNNIKDFEDTVTDMHIVYIAGANKDYEKLYSSFKFELNENEKEKVKKFAEEYYEFHENEFREILNEIIENETPPESKNDCWGLLYSYIDRPPSRWECDIVWETEWKDLEEEDDSESEEW